jgi:hypothetical protein
VFTSPMHSAGSYSIVDSVFVAEGICLPSRCLAMNVYSGLTVLSFGRHVTIILHITSINLWLGSNPGIGRVDGNGTETFDINKQQKCGHFN